MSDWWILLLDCLACMQQLSCIQRVFLGYLFVGQTHEQSGKSALLVGLGQCSFISSLVPRPFCWGAEGRRGLVTLDAPSHLKFETANQIAKHISVMSDICAYIRDIACSAIWLAVSSFKRDGTQIQEMFLTLPDPFLMCVRGRVWGRN